MTDESVTSFLVKFSEALQEGDAAIFAGPGLSRASGLVDWKRLLKSLADSLGVDIEKEADFLALAQYYSNARLGRRGGIERLLLENFSRNAELTPNHRILARLPISTYWTTNYDHLIEKSLEDAGKRTDVKVKIEQLGFDVPHRDVVIYKMHGDVDSPDDAVLIKDDYENYHVDREPFLITLKAHLLAKTFLFIGLSFEDPDIDYVMSRVRTALKAQKSPTHFWLIKDIASDYDSERSRYQKRRQDLLNNDLLRFNIEMVWVDSFGHITEILQNLERIYRSKSVFMSGAAHEWGAAWPTERARSFIRGLSKTLLNKGCRLVSGFGFGVGSSVISGALEHIYATKRGKIEDQLILRPFPNEMIGPFEWEAIARRYREDMADYAGAAVFLFGNKLKDGQVMLSDSMAQEFDVCKEKGLALIPVGATGYMAKQLWDKVMADFAAYYPHRTDEFKPLLDTLGNGDADPGTLIDAVIRVLDLRSQE